MTQYYRIQPELDDFMLFQLDNYDFLVKLGDELELSDFGQPLQQQWQPVKARFIARATVNTIPDITTWQTDMLVLNQKAYDALGEIFSRYGELLPLEVESGTFYLLNMLERLPDDIIDEENSEYEYFEEEPVGFRVLNFNANKVPEDKLLFCAQNNFAYNIYCDDRLIKLMAENDLHGLHFNTTLIDPYFKYQ